MANSPNAKTQKEIYTQLQSEFGEEIILSFVDPKEEQAPQESSVPQTKEGEDKKPAPKKVLRAGDSFILIKRARK